MRFAGLIIAATLSVSACASSRQITDLKQFLPKDTNPCHSSIDSVLRKYFKPKAYEAIKHIPTINGPSPSGYASGTTLWSNIVSFLTFNGVGRKVIIPSNTFSKWGFSCIIHEYVHQLEDMDRDGEGEWIDQAAFERAYHLMSKDMKWKGLVYWTESRANSWFTDTFGIGKTSEHIAYVAQQLIVSGGPHYMRYVYRNILNLSYDRSVTVVTTTGERLNLVLED